MTGETEILTITHIRPMKKSMSLALMLAACASMNAQNTAKALHYPRTPTDGTVDEYFGVKVPDPYRWLENDTSKETMEWVKEENKVTNDYLSKIPFRAKLLKRLKEVANYERVGAPFEKNGKWYAYRNNGLQNQSVLYVSDSPKGEAKVFLDPNKLSTDGTVALKSIAFSHDGKYMAYAISRSGSDWQEFYVMDTRTGKQLDDHIVWSKFSNAAWLGDGFYYSAYDTPTGGKELSAVNSVQKIYYHKLGTPQSSDVLFYQNPACPMRFYNTWVNKEETVQLLIESGNGAGNNIFCRDLRQQGSQFIQMTSDDAYTYSPIDIVGDNIYIFTNYQAPKGRVVVASLKNPGINDWQTVVPEDEDAMENINIINGRLVLTYMHDASSRAYVYSLDGKRLNEIALPGIGEAYFSGDKDRKECFYTFSSFTVPGTVYSYDMTTQTSQVFSQPKVKFNTNAFETKEVFVVSKDGTKVPVFLTYKKGLKLNGKNPTMLYGYGGFAISMPPYFAATRIPFLERGGIYAQACLRGGCEYGEEWHLAGTKMRKQNVFDDFIAAAEWLISKRYTSKDYLAINGGSNGGLLVGACMIQRPDLYKVAVPQVGVMDMLRYHKFTIGWNWAPDYGTSADSKEMFEYLKGYSPLHNLKAGTHYPATLITTADHDDRVVPAHSFKFAATLQADNAGNAPTLIRIESKAGHGGGKPLSKQLEEKADIYSFILYNMGLKY